MKNTLRLVPGIVAATLLLSGCVVHDRGFRSDERIGVSVGSRGNYDGYYDGSYGAFNDGYWGNDGAFYYSDSSRNWHRDDGNHFRRDHGDGDNWNSFHGSGHSLDH